MYTNSALRSQTLTGYAALFLLSACAFLLSVSCSSRIGYGVVTWSVPELSLVAGDVLPVFIQSNIGKVYVVGVGEKRETRAELPLWRIQLHKTKSGAQKASAAIAEYRYTYATVMLDGLPVRQKPENTARQVYRLRESETIKIIRKGEGTPVIASNTPLEGDWFEVMTDDGTTGWSFSYNLSLFDERGDGALLAATAASSGTDTILENLLARSWYPDSWRTMIQDNQVDLSRINLQWGFFPGRESGIARIDGIEGSVSFPYTSIAKGDDGLYRFEGSSLTVSPRGADQILLQFTDSAGMPQTRYFASLEVNPAELVRIERQRRNDLLGLLIKAGPAFSSGNYGVLQFLPGGKFLWSGWQLLSPSIIPAGAGGSGRVDLSCFIKEPLASEYDGALTFVFEATKRELTFLYKITDQGLTLEYVNEANIKDQIVQGKNLNPTVMFFTPEKAGQGGL